MSVPGASQPAPSPSTPQPMPVAERAARVRYRRALALVAMTLVLPGSAQLLAGNRAVGRWAIRITVALLGAAVTLGVIAVFWHELPLWAATTPWALQWLRIVLILLGVAWAALFVDAWRLGDPLTLRMGHRRTTILINGGLAVAVLVALGFGAHVVSTQRSLMLSMFGGDTKSAAIDGRYNVLLIGADSGATRWGMRTDSMTVASIDASTGKTVLIGLPRNMQNFPFAPGSVMRQQFPHGYDCSGCELNSLSTYAYDHQDLFKAYQDPRVEATIEGIEGITGLTINYWAMVNLQGFRDLSDALGGVTLNVRQPIAIGPTGHITGWIPAGVQKLSGDQLLWYARSRATSDDYSRMARQKCVMNAMLTQLSPTAVLTHYTKLANATKGMVNTSIPASEVDTFLNLALKAKSQQISTVSLVPPLVNTYKPNIKVIQAAVQKAIDPPPPAPAAPATGKPAKKKQPVQADTMTEGSYGSMKTGYTANETDNLAAAC
jgi:polyisoprenyl-teichoic acid--peptidoglycan teichoic acid transferase